MTMTDNTSSGYIELNNFLKIKGIVPTGGQAKILIRSEEVKVNGAVETRNKKKLHIGDKIDVKDQSFVVDDTINLKR